MLGEKINEAFHAVFQQHRQVAAVDHIFAQVPAAFDQQAKVGVEFRRSAGQVDGLHGVTVLDQLQHALNVRARHLLGTRRPGVYVAVAAGLVAALAQVDLHGCDRAGRQGKFTAALQSFFEGVSDGFAVSRCAVASRWKSTSLAVHCWFNLQL